MPRVCAVSRTRRSRGRIGRLRTDRSRVVIRRNGNYWSLTPPGARISDDAKAASLSVCRRGRRTRWLALPFARLSYDKLAREVLAFQTDYFSSPCTARRPWMPFAYTLDKESLVNRFAATALLRFALRSRRAHRVTSSPITTQFANGLERRRATLTPSLLSGGRAQAAIRNAISAVFVWPAARGHVRATAKGTVDLVVVATDHDDAIRFNARKWFR